MAHDEHKGRCNRYYPEGDTIHGMVERGNWRATAGNFQPHQVGPRWHHTVSEQRDKTLGSQGHPKAREGLNTLGFPIPYLPSASADGILIPVAFQRMAQYTRKQICNGYEPAGETIHGMVEGGNWKVTEKASSHSPEWTLWTPRWRRGKE